MKTSSEQVLRSSSGDEKRHIRWLILWVAGMFVSWLWARSFLNLPALGELEDAFLNSIIGGLAVVVMTIILGWATAISLDYFSRSGYWRAHIAGNFLVNLIRSIPQIVGILLGYIIVTRLMLSGDVGEPSQQLFLTAVIISLVVFPDVVELIRQRIDYFRGLEFYDAMLCCGIPPWRIINSEILLKNSIAHIVHKAVAVFGMAIFLQCSIDFIISVGLTADVSSTNFPVTLGSLLARMDSKQDILAVSNLFTDPTYAGVLFTRHLQGIGVAWSIVYTLLCSFNIANGIVRRYRL